MVDLDADGDTSPIVVSPSWAGCSKRPLTASCNGVGAVEMALLVPYESTANLLRAKERPTDETHYPSSPSPADHTKALTWPAKKRELPPTRKRPAEPTNHRGRTQGDQKKHRQKEKQPEKKKGDRRQVGSLTSGGA